jgi:hypothetical protein
MTSPVEPSPAEVAAVADEATVALSALAQRLPPGSLLGGALRASADLIRFAAALELDSPGTLQIDERLVGWRDQLKGRVAAALEALRDVQGSVSIRRAVLSALLAGREHRRLGGSVRGAAMVATASLTRDFPHKGAVVHALRATIAEAVSAPDGGSVKGGGRQLGWRRRFALSLATQLGAERLTKSSEEAKRQALNKAMPPDFEPDVVATGAGMPSLEETVSWLK